MLEERWIERARDGSQDAFARLLERYEKQVFHHALRMVGNSEDAADLTQDVFLKVWLGLPAFQGDSAFSTWLYRLTSNACIDFLRREAKHRGNVCLDGDEGALCERIPDAAPSPQRELERAEVQAAVRDGLMGLSEDHRQVLVLREIDALSYEEIGRVLDLNPGTVKSRIARARLALAKILRENGNLSGYLPSDPTGKQKGGGGR